MATNYTYIDHGGVHIIKTKASNIQLVSFQKLYGEDKYIRDTSYYGMNASFFNTTVPTSNLLNIVYQNGTYVGPGTQGYTNAGCGTSIVCWNGSNLNLYDNVQNGSSSLVPKNSGSWAQGGYNLYLSDSNWKDKFGPQGEPTLLNGGSARTGILINTILKEVYLFMTPATIVTVEQFRSAMISYVIGIVQSNGPQWKGILTDGGKSAQMVCAEVDLQTLISRKVPQIIALKNKT